MEKRHLNFIVLLLLLYAPKVFAQTPSERHNTKPIGTTAAQFGYYEYLPSNYSSSSNLPLVIFLHGIGEAGDGNEAHLNRLLKHGPPKLVEMENKDFPFVLLTPQTRTEWIYITKKIKTFIQYAKENYKIDPTRIYITGLSMGGGGTWYSADFSDEVAAIVPICGSDTQYWNPCAFKNMGVWAFHNSEDTRVPVEKTIRMVDTIRSCGGNPLLTVYKATGHDAWTVTYQDQRMWDWLLTQKKGALTPSPNKVPTAEAGPDKEINLPDNSTTVTATVSDTDGSIQHILWKKISGPAVTMSGIYSSTLTLSDLVEGVYKFRLIATDNLNAASYDDVTVTVKGTSCASKNFPISILASQSNPVCTSLGVRLTVNEEFDSYEWSTGETTKSIVARNTGTFSVKGYYNTGCSSKEVSHSVTFSIPYTKPTIAIKDSSIICSNDSIVLKTKSEYHKYHWSTGEKTPTIAITKTGLYYVSVESEGGCLTPSDTIFLKVLDAPARPEIIIGGEDTLQSSVKADKYHWYLNDQKIDSTNRTINIKDYKGSYSLVVESNGCLSNPSEVVIPAKEATVRVFPIPTKGPLYLKMGKVFARDVKVNIYDFAGKLVSEERFDAFNPEVQLEIKTDHLLKGMYILKIDMGFKVVTKRIIKTEE